MPRPPSAMHILTLGTTWCQSLTLSLLNLTLWVLSGPIKPWYGLVILTHEIGSVVHLTWSSWRVHLRVLCWDIHNQLFQLPPINLGEAWFFMAHRTSVTWRIHHLRQRRYLSPNPAYPQLRVTLPGSQLFHRSFDCHVWGDYAITYTHTQMFLASIL